MTVRNPIFRIRFNAGTAWLTGWAVAVAVIWLLILPWVAKRPAMSSHLQWLDERGIDPSAMYYTELEAMRPILDRLER